MWQPVAELVAKNQRFLLTTHINPDGDAIGSVMALGDFLEGLGKEVAIVNSSHTPRSCQFLDPHNKIRVYPDNYDASILDKAQVVIVTDVNNWAQVGSFADVLRKTRMPRVCIDHHQSVEDGFADVVISDTSAAAAGLLVYEFILEMGHTPTNAVRDAIYTTLIADTGSFRFSNTDVRVMNAATELIRLGADPAALHRKAFAKTPEAVRLLGVVLGSMRTEAGGKLIALQVTQDMLRTTGATYEDSDGMVDVVRTLENVEFVLFFKELQGGRIRVSLRSNGKVDAHAIAIRYGGGGHRMASGMTLDGPLAAAVTRVLDDCLATEPALKANG